MKKYSRNIYEIRDKIQWLPFCRLRSCQAYLHRGFHTCSHKFPCCSRHFWQVVDVVNSFRYLFLTLNHHMQLEKRVFRKGEGLHLKCPFIFTGKNHVASRNSQFVFASRLFLSNSNPEEVQNENRPFITCLSHVYQMGDNITNFKWHKRSKSTSSCKRI